MFCNPCVPCSMQVPSHTGFSSHCWPSSPLSGEYFPSWGREGWDRWISWLREALDTLELVGRCTLPCSLRAYQLNFFIHRDFLLGLLYFLFSICLPLRTLSATEISDYTLVSNACTGFLFHQVHRERKAGHCCQWRLRTSLMFCDS